MLVVAGVGIDEQAPFAGRVRAGGEESISHQG
jgi:hypothetical protein